jgi:hypothetical protein
MAVELASEGSFSVGIALAAVSISIIGNSPGGSLVVSSSVVIAALFVVIDIFHTTPVNGCAHGIEFG